ncbi:MAG: DUF479 domain-containing protein [Saprospiraceae bacterium]|nr:DUF479 domain-containing protein [Saprospiraceae bacterium]
MRGKGKHSTHNKGKWNGLYARMNFLGHLLLAHPDENLMVGNYLGDLVHKKEVPFLPESYHLGILFHRFIDHFTDQNPSVDQMNVLMREAVGKYAPVATDIIMDYFIHQNWQDLHHENYQIFSQKVYQILSNSISSFPTAAGDLTAKMIQGKWLQQYQSLEGMEDVMRRMNRKAKFSVDFTQCISLIIKHEAQINDHFTSFYKEIDAASQDWINLQNAVKS